jgi:alpha-galactosidase
MYATDGFDAYGRSSIQLWSGSLESTTGGDQDDQVVLLINGNNATTVMNATLADIFVDNGPAGTASQVKLSWEVRDLWANRMSDPEAQAIISASSAAGNATNGWNATRIGAGRYNATKTSYADGIDKKDPLLLGKVSTTVKPSGTIIATVAPHGAAMFRLRAVPTGTKDEL